MKSGELSGHGTGPQRPIHLPENIKCAVTRKEPGYTLLTLWQFSRS